MARFAMATFGAPEGGPYSGPTPPSYQNLCGHPRLLAVLSVVAPVHTIDVDQPPDEFSANRHLMNVSCCRGLGVHANEVENDRLLVGRRAGGIWPTCLGAAAGRASPLPARRRLSDTAYPQLLLSTGSTPRAQPRHPGRRRLGRAADGLALRHRATGRGRLHLAAAVACPGAPSWPMPSTAPTRSIRRPAPSSRSGGSTISTCSCAPRKCRWRCRIG